MRKEDIEQQIETIKTEIKVYQKFAQKLQIDKKQTEEQINKYLETLHLLIEMLKNLNE